MKKLLTTLVAIFISAFTVNAVKVEQSLVVMQGGMRIGSDTNPLPSGVLFEIEGGNSYYSNDTFIVNAGEDTNYNPIIKAYGTNATGADLANGHWIAIDGVADSQKGFVWAEEGIPYWNEEIFNSEGGDYLYLRSRQAKNNVLTYSSGGRVGVNKAIDIMDYHSRFVGSGSNDMTVGGTYLGKILRVYKIIIVGTGTPDTWQYACSIDKGISYTTNATVYECSVTVSNVEKGITVQWDADTGHTVNDYWQFAGYPQLPEGTFTINPDSYNEILTTTNINLTITNYVDLTYNLSTIDDGNPNIVLEAGTNSAIYLGSLMKRNAMYFDISTFGQGVGLLCEYWGGGAWKPITVATNYLLEGTINLTQNGFITWDKSTMTDWSITNCVVDNYTNLYYWIRVRSTNTITLAPQCYGIMPNGQYRFAIYAGKFDYNPVLFINGDGKIHTKTPLYIEGFRTNANEAPSVEYVQRLIAEQGQVTYYFHDTTNAVDTFAYNLQTFGPESAGTILTTNNITGTAKIGFIWLASNALTTTCTVPEGTWNVFTYSYVNSIVAGTVSRWIAAICVRRANGTTNEIARATSQPITSTSLVTIQPLQISVFCTNFIIAAGDRYEVIMYATNSGAARNLSIGVEGNTLSRVVTPFSSGTAIDQGYASEASLVSVSNKVSKGTITFSSTNPTYEAFAYPVIVTQITANADGDLGFDLIRRNATNKWDNNTIVYTGMVYTASVDTATHYNGMYVPYNTGETLSIDTTSSLSTNVEYIIWLAQ